MGKRFGREHGLCSLGIPRKTEAMDISWDMADMESAFRRKPGPSFRVLGIVAGGIGLGVGVWNTPELEGLIREGFLEVGLRRTWVGIDVGGEPKGVQP